MSKGFLLQKLTFQLFCAMMPKLFFQLLPQPGGQTLPKPLLRLERSHLMLDRFERFSLAISEINRHWHKLAAEELAPYGLKSAHATYLTAMARHPEGITVPELCSECGKDKSDASRMLAILEEKGLVTKEPTGGSRYRGLMKLTPTGQKAAEHVCRRAAAAVEAAGRDLSPEARETFYRALDSITAHLRVLSKDGIPQE
jgi:DNA-binding MarR family transcriptional regulator